MPLKPRRSRQFSNRNMRAWCGCCGVDTGWDGLGEWYMVKDTLWNQAWPGTSALPINYSKPRYFLCIGCLETLLGRRLTQSDFIADNPLNDPTDPYISARLRERLTADSCDEVRT